MPINFHQIKNFIRHWLTATRKGHNVHSPFVYKLCEEIFYNNSAFYDFEQLEEIRSALKKNKTILNIEDFGAGSKTMPQKRRSVTEIAKSGISTQKQSQIIYKLINFFYAGTIIELGTSLGLNTLYLAMANKKARLYSIEGSRELFDFSSQLINEAKVKNVTLMNGKFDDELPVLLNQINKVDVFYVDGNHTYESTLQYFRSALPKRTNDSVFIFDDIYWSHGMTRAWHEIKNDAHVTLSIDAFYFGMIFFKQEVKEKVHLKILI
ncbi:MAG: class SAM-dependent methyltransferase [Bacteroidetes bacterium]|nr:class SAM-dependent methyltransferase [Bacteroidota bacterium]